MRELAERIADRVQEQLDIVCSSEVHKALVAAIDYELVAHLQRERDARLLKK